MTTKQDKWNWTYIYDTVEIKDGIPQYKSTHKHTGDNYWLKGYASASLAKKLKLIIEEQPSATITFHSGTRGYQTYNLYRVLGKQ